VRQAAESTAWNTADGGRGERPQTWFYGDLRRCRDRRRRAQADPRADHAGLVHRVLKLGDCEGVSRLGRRPLHDLATEIDEDLDQTEDLIRNRESRYLLPDLGQRAHHMTVGSSTSSN
jgi:hypothetical protein